MNTGRVVEVRPEIRREGATEQKTPSEGGPIAKAVDFYEEVESSESIASTEAALELAKVLTGEGSYDTVPDGVRERTHQIAALIRRVFAGVWALVAILRGRLITLEARVERLEALGRSEGAAERWLEALEDLQPQPPRREPTKEEVEEWGRAFEAAAVRMPPRTTAGERAFLSSPVAIGDRFEIVHGAQAGDVATVRRINGAVTRCSGPGELQGSERAIDTLLDAMRFRRLPRETAPVEDFTGASLADEAGPTEDELLAFARSLALEGDLFGLRVVGDVERGQRITSASLSLLYKIREERSAVARRRGAPRVEPRALKPGETLEAGELPAGAKARPLCPCTSCVSCPCEASPELDRNGMCAHCGGRPYVTALYGDNGPVHVTWSTGSMSLSAVRDIANLIAAERAKSRPWHRALEGRSTTLCDLPAGEVRSGLMNGSLGETLWTTDALGVTCEACAAAQLRDIDAPDDKPIGLSLTAAGLAEASPVRAAPSVVEWDPWTFRLRTFTGVEWDPMHPDPEQIRIADVARSLALQCRFGGHLSAFYSVAQHSVLVSQLVEPPFALAALLHEVAEALSGFGDVLGPLKRVPEVAAVVKPIERAIDDAAAERFGLPQGFASCPEVKRADLLAYEIEDYNLRGIGEPQPELVPLSWRLAEDAFLRRFAELGGVQS